MAKKRNADELVDRTFVAKRESKYIEFKQAFDPGAPGDWCEIIKDVVAIANTGGGCIVFGVDNHGKPVKANVDRVVNLDPSEIVDKVAKYTAAQAPDIGIHLRKKSSVQVVLWRIPGVDVPMVFVSPGTYADGVGKQKTAFSRGTIYFRHGAKSEPANQNDLRNAIERRLEQLRTEWLKNLRKVSEAPEGYKVRVLPPEVLITDHPNSTAVRLTDDPTAPAFFRLTPDTSHPFRQKELVTEVNKRLPKGVSVNQYDIRAIRTMHNTDGNETFTYHPAFTSAQYSPAYVDWIVRQFEKDNNFFEHMRSEFYAKTRLDK